MDPLGFGATIFGLIRAIYWGSAIAAVAAALFIPKTSAAKAGWTSFVIVLFGYLPVSELISAKRQKDMYTQSCARNELVIHPMDSVRGFFMAPTSDYQMRSFAFYVKYMVKRNMSFLEAQNVFQQDGYHALGSDYIPRKIDPQSLPFVRLSIEESGDPRCDWFYTWSRKYPSQKLPMLRNHGFPPSACVAIDGGREITSRYVMRFEEKPIDVMANGYGLHEQQFTVEDAEKRKLVAHMRASTYKGPGGSRVLCDKSEDYKKFQEVVPIDPDSRYIAWQIETIDEPKDFSRTGVATEADISHFVAMKPNLDFSTNLVNEDASVWFESKYDRKSDASGSSISLSGYYMVTLAGKNLRRTRLKVQDRNVGDFESLAVTPSSIFFIALQDARRKTWLLEYSRDGSPRRAVSLSAAQYERIRQSQGKRT